MCYVSGEEMHALREIHLRVLSVISQHMPLGATPSQIVKEAPIPAPASAQKLNQYLNALLKKGLVEKRREAIRYGIMMETETRQRRTNACCQATK